MIAEHNYIGANTSWIDVGDNTRAFLTTPKDGTGPFPAVIIGHERYGLVQHTLDLAAKWASYGYVCVAPDMASHWEGDKEALNRGDIGLTLTDDQVRYYYGLCLDYLLEASGVDSACIASMGVCQSGGYPLLLNSIRPEVCASLVIYGGSRTPEEVIAACTAPILGIFGEADHTMSIETVDAFRNLIQKHQKSYEFTMYADMPHGWLNDTMPGRYRQRAAEAVWIQMVQFLEKVSAGGFPRDRVRWRWESDISTTYDFSKMVRLA
ncbi:MAG: dienelactone hydrolase family protein [Chloroflexota bacterium]